MEENSDTTQEFTKHTESITDTVRHVDSEVDEIANVVSQVESKIRIGTERSNELSDKVSKMRNNVSSSLEITSQRIEENKNAIAQVMLNLQSLTRIDEMAKQILEITSQTNLLSLNEYYFSIEEIQTIIKDIEESSNVFADVVSNIRNQIQEVQNMPGNTVISTDEIISKLEKIEKMTEELSVVVNVNQNNAVSIREIVERFSDYEG